MFHTWAPPGPPKKECSKHKKQVSNWSLKSHTRSFYHFQVREMLSEPKWTWDIWPPETDEDHNIETSTA